MKPKITKPVFLITYGYPAAGKSMFAHQFAHDFKLSHISADRIRYELFDDPQFTSAEEQVITSLMGYMLEQTMKLKVGVIYDRNFNSKKRRKELINSAIKNGYEPLIVWIQTDKETALYRAQNRDRRKAEDRFSFPISSTQFNTTASKLTRPDREPFTVISGKHDYRTQARAVINKLNSLGVIERQVPTSSHTGRVDTVRRQVKAQDVGRA